MTYPNKEGHTALSCPRRLLGEMERCCIIEVCRHRIVNVVSIYLPRFLSVPSILIYRSTQQLLDRTEGSRVQHAFLICFISRSLGVLCKWWIGTGSRNAHRSSSMVWKGL
jgi:hypothetical protein